VCPAARQPVPDILPQPTACLAPPRRSPAGPDALRALGPPHPYLGELAIRTSAPEKASEIHREALAKEIELGAAAEEARALAGLGRSQLAGASVDAAMNLREALPIYQRIGAPEARLVQDTLDEHGLSAATGHLARRPAIRFQSSSMPTPSVIGPLSRA
jgi:hypothetical protein